MKKLFGAIVISMIFVTQSFAAWSIEGTGSSFQYPANNAWAKSFYAKTKNKVNYSPTGSGAGLKAVAAGQVNFGGSDKPLKPSILRKKSLIQFPIAIGAIVLSYNVPGVLDLKLSEEAIAGILLGKIKYWDSKIIKKHNPQAKLLHKKILFVHRSDKSGTTFSFSYYLSKMNREWRSKYGAKKQINWPTANRIAGKGNFGVATAIKNNLYSIGYIDYSDARSKNLNMAIIESKAGKFVEPSIKNFTEGAKYAELNPKKDFYANIQYPKSGYPIITATFILVPKNNKNSKNVVSFFDFAYNNPKIISNLGYIPLSKKTIDNVRKYWVQKN